MSTNKVSIPANVFNALFSFRPGYMTTPKENFLTEALIYALRSSNAAVKAWVTLLTDGAIRPRSCEIETRSSHREGDEGYTIYPDVVVTGIDQSGHSYRLIVEHKWDSPFNELQLRRYSKLRKRGETLHLAFVSPNKTHEAALGFISDRRVNFRATTWEAVYATLFKVKPQIETLAEFLIFMRDQALSPGQPISSASLIECASPSVQDRLKHKSVLRTQMRKFCQKLLNEYEWDQIPKRYQDMVSDNWGRCVVNFMHKAEIALGFYYDTKDHKADFTSPERGIDLYLRVIVHPKKNPNPTNLLALFALKAGPLRRRKAVVRIKGDVGNGNRYSVLMVQKNLLGVFGSAKTEEEQIDAMYQELRKWLEILFSDQTAWAALEKIEPF